MTRSCRTYRVDILLSPEAIAVELARMGVGAEYISFLGYAQPTHPKDGEGGWVTDELVVVNINWPSR